MKRVIAIFLICGLGACASSGNKDMNNVSQTKQSTSGYDDSYMTRVESQATQRGVVVRWIHPPKARVKKGR